MAFAELIPANTSKDDLARRRKIAQSLMQQGTSGAPVTHWLQAMNNAATGIRGGLTDEQTNKDEKARRKAIEDALAGGMNPEEIQNAGVSIGDALMTRVGGNRMQLAQDEDQFGRKLNQTEDHFGRKLDQTEDHFGRKLDQGNSHHLDNLGVKNERTGIMRGNADIAAENLKVAQGRAAKAAEVADFNIAQAKKEWDVKVAKAATEQKTARDKHILSVDQAWNDSNDALTAIDNLFKSHTAGAYKSWFDGKTMDSDTTGMTGKIKSYIFGSNAYNMDAAIRTIKAKIGTGTLQALRKASANGASGFGQLTQMELQRLEDSIANLDQAQSNERFLENARIVQNRYNDIMAKVEEQKRRLNITQVHRPDAQ